MPVGERNTTRKRSIYECDLTSLASPAIGRGRTRTVGSDPRDPARIDVRPVGRRYRMEARPRPRLSKSSDTAKDSDAVFSDAAVAHGKLRFLQGGHTVSWTDLGVIATSALAAAGGTSGIVIDNTASSGTIAGTSQVYFSTLGNRTCGPTGVGVSMKLNSRAGVGCRRTTRKTRSEAKQ